MAYSRPVLPGVGLRQRPVATNPAQTGIQQTTLDVDIATTFSLGVVQVGSGLNITPAGVLSVNNSGYINVTLTNINYTALLTDYYIGATAAVTITLPPGVVGKVMIIKNQKTDDNGKVTVKCSGSEKLDSSSSKTLGEEASLIVVFDGTRWNII
jgi:hypothetical protein